ncbi:MAG: class I SAM-dependent methyltransferase [Lachnospiraceae bacterium]|nr:class I SAM-dependent methyltransferase [Lachnospiraceae bacterium]
MRYIHKYLELLRQDISLIPDRKVPEDIPSKQESISVLYPIEEHKEMIRRDNSEIKILDIGAGTGRYSVALAEEGYDVTAVELVKYNLGILKQKGSTVKAMQGNALKLSKLENNSFDLTLLFGPMYHLFTKEDKCQALREAMRVTKSGGIIMVAYCMNEYCVLTYAFKEKHLAECLAEGRLNETYHSRSEMKDLYDYVRLEDINAVNEEVGIQRLQILSPDGPTNYMRNMVNEMNDEEFAHYMDYIYAICERQDLIGAAAHTVDILKNN